MRCWNTTYRYQRPENKFLPWMYPLWLGVISILIGLTIIFFPQVLVWLLSTMLFVLGATLIYSHFTCGKTYLCGHRRDGMFYDFYV
jgi:uncharacterized membrane protein HdeD (DUF308 family)